VGEKLGVGVTSVCHIGINKLSSALSMTISGAVPKLEVPPAYKVYVRLGYGNIIPKYRLILYGTIPPF
jgi:hypothetical protein